MPKKTSRPETTSNTKAAETVASNGYRELRFKDPANISAEEVAVMAQWLNIAALFQTIADLPELLENQAQTKTDGS